MRAEVKYFFKAENFPWKEKGMTAINKVNGYRSVARSKTIDVMKPGQRPVPSHGIWPRAQKRIEFLIEKIGQTK